MAYLLVGRLFAAFSMWLALLILAKMADPATVGLYALAQAICIPVTEVGKTGLRDIYASDPDRAHRFGSYLGFRLAATVIAFGVITASSVMQSATGAVLLVILLYGVVRCGELVSDMIHGLFQGQERMEYVGRSLCLVGPTSMLFLTLGYWASGSLTVAILGQILAQIGVLIFYDIPNGRRRADLVAPGAFRPRLSLEDLRALLPQAIPLAVATALAMVAIYLPRLVIEAEFDLQALGYFAAITALAMAPNRLVNILGVALSVRLARHHRNGETARFLRIIGGAAGGVLLAGGVGLLIAVVYGDLLLRLVYTDAYADYGRLLVWALSAAILRSLADVLKFGMIASRRFWWITVQYGVVAATTVLGCVTLIPAYGLDGAGAVLVLVFGVNVLVIIFGLALNLPRGGKSKPIA